VKAALFQAPGGLLALQDVSDPQPLPHEVVVRIGRCGICASDLHMTDKHCDWLRPGEILGHEFAGEVVARGRDVASHRIGDRVAVLPASNCGTCAPCRAGDLTACSQYRFRQGGYAQFAAAAAENCINLPSDLSMADGALIEPLAVARHGALRAGVAAGSSVLIIGAGPIGLASAYWAKRLGAREVAVAALSRRNEAVAARMGVNHFLLAGEALGADFTARFGAPPEIVLECTGIAGQIASAMNLVRRRGTVGILGMCMQMDAFSPVVGISKEATLKFSATYRLDDFQQAADAMDAGGIEPRAMITASIGLDELPATFESLRARTPHCKVQVDPWMKT
jgi:(R,R)-butanediol dehydrogenase/meso-butanediol dehydrogenase/diacetyl reductase